MIDTRVMVVTYGRP